MPLTFQSLPDLLAHGFDSVIDVRSPAEFAEDHVPGAINLPALSNDERAEVGTIYKQISPFSARKTGAAMVARNVAAHLDGRLRDMPGSWRPFVYCWRGGQRSGSVATILRAVGWRAETMDGGYKAYRGHVVSLLYEAPVAFRPVLLDGNTGTAKTAVLAELAQLGVQVIDLEALASHRGSILGANTEPQPSQKAFESSLAEVIVSLDARKPVVIEAEASKIGDLLVPMQIWRAMCAAPRIRIEAPVSARATYLTQAYRNMVDDPDGLSDRLQQLIPIQGHDRVEAWQSMAQSGAFHELAKELMCLHYDPRYKAAATSRSVNYSETFSTESLEPRDIGLLADRIAQWLTEREVPHPEVSADR